MRPGDKRAQQSPLFMVSTSLLERVSGEGASRRLSLGWISWPMGLPGQAPTQLSGLVFCSSLRA